MGYMNMHLSLMCICTYH